VRANGQVIEMRGQPLPGGGYVTTYSDVTDYKRAEHALREVNETLEARVELRTREAEQANHSRTRFLAAVSHDVLQPINAARLFTSALRDADGEADEQRRLAERVDASLRDAEELLDGLLDISRLDAGSLKPEIAVFRLDELVASVAAQYAPLAAVRGLRFGVHGGPLAVRSDRRLLRRALQNFVANALRYTKEGRVVIGTRRRGDQVGIEVWDSGPGIPPHHLAQIFDEFRRFDQPSPWGERGLGLGLSICQRVSRMLDHPIGVRSWPGRGSVFSIRVPIADTPAPATPPRAPLPTGDLGGLKVLCLDNDREILDGLQALLGRWGVDVRVAETVAEALAVAQADRPDVLVADYHLHDELDGLGALQALRAVCGPHTPAVLVTADGSDDVKRTARDLGIPVLTKPVKPASLRAFLAAQRRGA
jgi:signal transduction histidine kinase